MGCLQNTIIQYFNDTSNSFACEFWCRHTGQRTIPKECRCIFNPGSRVGQKGAYERGRGKRNIWAASRIVKGRTRTIVNLVKNLHQGREEKGPTHQQRKLMTFQPFSDLPSNEESLITQDPILGETQKMILFFRCCRYYHSISALAVCRLVLSSGVVVDGPLKLEGTSWGYELRCLFSNAKTSTGSAGPAVAVTTTS